MAERVVEFSNGGYKIRKILHKNFLISDAHYLVKFKHSENAIKFCKISTVDLSYVVPAKSTMEISQMSNF